MIGFIPKEEPMVRFQSITIAAFVLAAALITACAGAPTPTPVPPPPAPTQAAVSQPTAAPTAAPATSAPTTAPTTAPTAAPTVAPTQASAPVSGTFVLYTSESEDKVNEMVNDFKQTMPGVNVSIFRAGTGDVEAKLQAESQAGAIKADVIWMADSQFFKQMADQDQFLVYLPKGSDKVPAQYHYAGNRYHEVRLIFNTIAYNTTLVKTPPTSWNDMLDPKYKNKVAMPSPAISGAAFAQLGTFANMKEFGFDYFTKFQANGGKIEPSNGAISTKLASGEYNIALLVDFYARDLKTQGSPIDHIWPSEGALLVPTPIGIMKSSKNAEPAKAFLDYMYSDRGQRLFIKQSYIAVVPGLPNPVNTPDLSKLKVLTVDDAYIAAHRDEILKKFGDLFGIK
jgi:iron(III) transport system substrate-binding protein